ncbi:hypothetical protein PLICRDRAFT_77631, partial [Plicaturopsis crispa FD-325 SS-3]
LTRVENVSRCIEENGLTISSYIHHVLTLTWASAVMRKNLTEHASSICSDLYEHLPSKPSVTSWALGIARGVFCRERHGFRFNAAHATSEYLEGSFMKEAETKMRRYAPSLWELVQSLLDAKETRKRARKDPDSGAREMDEGRMDVERDLGEFGGHDFESMSDSEHDLEGDESDLDTESEP